VTVRELKTTEPNADLVERLEVLLKDAKSGEIQSIIGMVIYENGNPGDFWVAAPKGYHISIMSDRIIGCLERIKYQMLSTRHGIETEDVFLEK